MMIEGLFRIELRDRKRLLLESRERVCEHNGVVGKAADKYTREASERAREEVVNASEGLMEEYDNYVDLRAGVPRTLVLLNRFRFDLPPASLL
jgi:hypothetical protein